MEFSEKCNSNFPNAISKNEDRNEKERRIYKSNSIYSTITKNILF